MTYVGIIITLFENEYYKMNTYIWVHLKEYNDHINFLLKLRNPLENVIHTCRAMQTILQNAS